MKTDKFGKRLYESSAVVFAGLCFALLAVLFFVSIFRTIVYVDDARIGEYALSELDSGFFNIILLTVMVCASYLVYRVCEQIDFRVLMVFMCLWTLAIGCLFVYSASRAPEGDAEIIANTAYLAANGNYNVMADYFSRYPFSVGLAFYEELVFRFLKMGAPDISKGYCFMALEILNVILLCVSYLALVKTTGLIYKSRDVQKLLILLLMLFVPTIFSCTAINGRIPALCFAVLAMMFFACFAEKGNWLAVAASAVCMGVSLAMKLDTLLVFFAIVLVWLIRSFKEKRRGFFAALAVFAVLTILVSLLPEMLHRYRVEEEIHIELASARSALGLDETEQGSLIYSGMYSAVSTEISGFSVSEEKEDNTDLAGFYYQWNEPEFDSIRSNRNSRHYRDTGKLYQLVCYSGEKLLSIYLNLLQSFILAGAALSMLKLMKDRALTKLLPALMVLGGIILHLVFPAESPYALRYYLLLLPLAAYGYCAFFERFWAVQDRQTV